MLIWSRRRPIQVQACRVCWAVDSCPGAALVAEPSVLLLLLLLLLLRLLLINGKLHHWLPVCAHNTAPPARCC
jgi:hypothetical protein